mgnify:CR=1 FL=1
MQLSLAADGRVARACLALGGVSHAPIRLVEAEAALLGAACDDALFARAGAIASRVSCDGDELYPSAYKQDLCDVLVRRALKIAFQRVELSQHV